MRPGRIMAIAFLLPSALLAATAIAELARPEIGKPLFAGRGRSLLGAAAGLSGLSAGVIAFVVLVRLRTRTREVREAEGVIREDLRRIVSLQSQVELLTAMREVSRIISDDVDLDQILNGVCKILEDLLGCEAVTIFLPRGEEDTIVPVAHRAAGLSTCGAKLDPARIEDTNVAQAYAHRTLLREVDAGTIAYTVPLLADGDAIGVVRVELSLEGSPLEMEERSEGYEMVLRDIAKHVALAIKTPNLHIQAVQDPLTGLFTKRHFLAQLADGVRVSWKFGQPFSLILIDIDHFKNINDTYGHLIGDRVLAGVGAALRKLVRGTDSAYRYGGEELGVLMLGADEEKAERAAERIRKGIERTRFTDENNRRIKVTASLGVAALTPAMTDPEHLVAEADRALYAAKRDGRNRVVRADATPVAG